MLQYRRIAYDGLSKIYKLYLKPTRGTYTLKKHEYFYLYIIYYYYYYTLQTHINKHASIIILYCSSYVMSACVDIMYKVCTVICFNSLLYISGRTTTAGCGGGHIMDATVHTHTPTHDYYVYSTKEFWNFYSLL